MNIVLDCERMKHPNTGLYTFNYYLSRSIRQIMAVEDSLSLYIPPHTGHFLGEDVSYINYRPVDFVLPVFVKGMDIWHTTYQLSKYNGKSFRSRNVLTVHDLNFLHEDKDPAKFKRYIRKHQRRIDRADQIVAISEFAKKDILENLDIKGKPLSVIYNGSVVKEYEGFDNPRYIPQRPFIMTLGPSNKKKNFHVLPALLKGNDYELVIAGVVTAYAEKIKEQAKLHGVEDRVRIIGEISEQEKYWYMKNCEAFVFPSLAEGFGLPVIEAMHFGKPAFLSDRTSLPEVGGDLAYYFENFDPEYMRTVFEKGMHDFSRGDKTARVIEHADSFSWEKCARQYYDVYRSLV